MARSIEVRLNEYRDATLATATGLEEVSALLRQQKPDANTAPLDDGVRLYRLFAADLTKIIEGDELDHWGIEGVLPDAEQ